VEKITYPFCPTDTAVVEFGLNPRFANALVFPVPRFNVIKLKPEFVLLINAA
jgi:hypothetical protein